MLRRPGDGGKAGDSEQREVPSLAGGDDFYRWKNFRIKNFSCRTCKIVGLE